MPNQTVGFWGVLRRPFVLDLRALALLRMATAAVVLLDLAIRSTDLEAHYANLGVLPMAALLDHAWTPYQFSLHAASGMWQAEAVLFAIAAGLAVAMLLGYHTRLATVGSWVLLVSLQNRNPLIGQGGDDLLRMLLFWGIFLPWGRVWSWDAHGKPTPARLDYFSAATVAYIVQLALLYWCTALLKSGPEWTRDGTALYYAFSLDQVLMPGGRLLYPYPELLRFLTFATYYTELLLPFALFLPVGVARWRLLVVGVLFGFHLVISLTLFVGIFFLVNMASLLGLLPPVALDWLTRRLAPHLARARSWRPHLPAWQLPWRLRLERTTAPTPGSQRLLRAVRETFVAVVLAYVCWWNLDDVAVIRPTGGLMSEPMRWFGYLFRVDQHWGMFAPTVFKDDGWYILEGTTADGRKLDLNRSGAPVRYAKPASVVGLFKNDRWRKYSENYLFVSNAWMRPYYCNYLLRIWHENPAHAPLRHLSVVYMKEVSLPDYQLSTPTREVLCDCELPAVAPAIAKKSE
ncbi:HTTM domain-containing protein [Hymenobacter sp. BT770]|uniref:HTTM domain-containing protein n=1 Tax=Hymenobacter sp. BT770 TaxID=2886942 RepID=UPI001D100C71|nr:HTTM domain-containing protein [Hymenobacter sp. BT770]MCC3154239.1 HTTM domain-containing protein [Hymenobacter sp. BT770]MDO3416381.1 HTTM domain-containing protein [Hymenobacter sp. BT770]